MKINQISFAHKRYVDEKTGTPSGRGGLTVAYEQTDTDAIVYAYAKCHERDNFNKSQGRVKAAGRLCSPKHRYFFQGTREEFKNFFYNTPINSVGNV